MTSINTITTADILDELYGGADEERYETIVRSREASEASAEADEAYEKFINGIMEYRAEIGARIKSGEATDVDMALYHHDLRKDLWYSDPCDYMPEGFDPDEYIPEWERV